MSGNPVRGQMLLVAIVMATIVSVMLAAALQPLATAKQRMSEREMVYRAEHIAEGIRHFYKARGRFPFELNELLEAEPRYIRQLYKDPMTGEANWTLVYLNPTDMQAVKGLNRATRRLLAEGEDDLEDGGERNSENTNGGDKIKSLFRIKNQQITGIRSKSDETGLKERDDSRIYSDWLFSALPKPDLSLREALRTMTNEVEP